MREATAARDDVGGIWLLRPFKIRRLGHFGFDVEKSAAAPSGVGPKPWSPFATAMSIRSSRARSGKAGVARLFHG
jgi:hypothetical protein